MLSKRLDSSQLPCVTPGILPKGATSRGSTYQTSCVRIQWLTHSRISGCLFHLATHEAVSEGRPEAELEGGSTCTPRGQTQGPRTSRGSTHLASAHGYPRTNPKSYPSWTLRGRSHEPKGRTQTSTRIQTQTHPLPWAPQTEFEILCEV